MDEGTTQARRGLLHIERNMSRPIGAREIFALSGLSCKTEKNTFRAKLGQSVQTYVTSVKLREARRLLADSSIRISEVAYRCGFASPTYFCRTFAAAVGQSPKAYRSRI